MLPRYTLPRYSLPRYSLPRYALPRYSLPRYALPRYSLPRYALPRYDLSPHATTTHTYASKLSNSESQSELEASDGMRRSPRGESETEPTFGPSGIAERLNCCEKKRR